MKTTGKKDPLNVSCIKRSILRKKQKRKRWDFKLWKKAPCLPWTLHLITKIGAICPFSSHLCGFYQRLLVGNQDRHPFVRKNYTSIVRYAWTTSLQNTPAPAERALPLLRLWSAISNLMLGSKIKRFCSQNRNLRTGHQRNHSLENT